QPFAEVYQEGGGERNERPARDAAVGEQTVEPAGVAVHRGPVATADRRAEVTEGAFDRGGGLRVARAEARLEWLIALEIRIDGDPIGILGPALGKRLPGPADHPPRTLQVDARGRFAEGRLLPRVGQRLRRIG